MIILSSCDFRNENSKRVILNNLSKPIGQCKVLFFPNENATFETIHSKKFYLRLQEFGFTEANIHVFDYYNPAEFQNLDLDVIYISGGNTFKTLQRIRNCSLRFEGEFEMDEELLQTLSRALTHLVYRNTVVEDLHAEGVCLDDETMKIIN